MLGLAVWMGWVPRARDEAISALVPALRSDRTNLPPVFLSAAVPASRRNVEQDYAGYPIPPSLRPSFDSLRANGFDHLVQVILQERVNVKARCSPDDLLGSFRPHRGIEINTCSLRGESRPVVTAVLAHEAQHVYDWKTYGPDESTD